MVIDPEKTGQGYIGDEDDNLPVIDEDSQEEIAVTLLDTIISDQPLRMTEAPVDASVSATGVGVSHDQAGNRQLVFDGEVTSDRERELIGLFIQLYREGGKQALVNSDEFGWFFDEEGEDFLESLVSILERRVHELENGMQHTSLRNLGTNFNEALEFFRNKAHRRLIRESLSRQVGNLPIEKFQGKKADGTAEDLNFNPRDLDDPRNDIDFIFVSGQDGQQELIITYKDEQYTDIRPVMQGDNGSFDLVDGSFVEGSGEGPDGSLVSWWEFEVRQGQDTDVPIFTKVKILREPLDIEEAIDDYVAQKEAEEQRLRQEREAAERRRRAAQQQTYTPPPPAAPSTPRYTPSRPTYVRSG